MKSNGIKKKINKKKKNEQKNTTMIMYVYIDCSRLNGVSGRPIILGAFAKFKIKKKIA